MTAPSGVLPLYALAAVVLLVVLITWVRLHAFIALLIVSTLTGLASGMAPAAIMTAFQDGVGSTLGFTAVVIALGAILGMLITESGGAAAVATRVTSGVPAAALPWVVALVGFVVGLPVFFSVGLVLLIPIVVGLARSSGRSLASLALPLVAGLSASHGLVAPHPGPLVAIDRLGADPGRSILFALIAGIPAMLIAGPLFARWGARGLVSSGPAVIEPSPSATHATRAPSASLTIGIILLPIVLMLAATLADATLPPGTSARWWIDFAGSPLAALLIATLVGYAVLGAATGADRRRLATMSEQALVPLAGVLLVVGAGGGFGRVLDRAGVGEAIASAVAGWHLSPILFGWVLAALLRVAVGSATVAITTAAGIVAPIALARPDVSRELIVVALGAGSLVASHVNDAGFWLVKEYLGLSVSDTLRTWTILETIISVVALLIVLGLSTLLTAHF